MTPQSIGWQVQRGGSAARRGYRWTAGAAASLERVARDAVAARRSTASAARRRAGLAAELRQAMARDELEVHFQPIVRLSDRRTVGVEALLRWRHPRRGLLPPAEFIPAAEESGLIVQLGRWVLRAACARVIRWEEQLGGRIDLAVNVSSLQLDDGFAVMLMALLDELGFDPRRLVLEITETAMVQNLVAACVQLEALRALGVRVAIDDFGSGYSSLAYLRSLPADIVKIDRVFVRGVDAPGPGQTLITSMVRLLRGLRVTMVAEGIETEAEHAHLTSLGIDQGQGFLFGRPVRAAPGLPLAGTAVRGGRPGATIPERPASGAPAPQLHTRPTSISEAARDSDGPLLPRFDGLFSPSPSPCAARSRTAGVAVPALSAPPAPQRAASGPAHAGAAP